jgi:translation initiation factor IF-1
MSKQDVIEFQGVVTDLLPESRCKVQLENGHTVLCYTAGKLKKHKIRMLVGDQVTVEMTPYDLTKGRITYRGKRKPRE